MTNVDHLPLCGGGRCSALLAGVADLKTNQVRRNGTLMAEVLMRALAEYGVDATAADVQAVVVRHIAAVTGVTAGNEPGS